MFKIQKNQMSDFSFIYHLIFSENTIIKNIIDKKTKLSFKLTHY